MAVARALSGEGLLPAPKEADPIGREFDVWLIGNGTSVEFQGGRYRKLRSEPDGTTDLLGDGDIEISVPHGTKVFVIKENQ